jgi:hypothetical protein
MKKITVQVTTEVPFQSVADVICNAIEGGSNYWCHDFIREDGPDLPNFYAEGEFYESGNYRIRVRFDNPEDEGDKTIWIGPEQVEAGVQLVATKHPLHFADLIEGSHDAETGDVLLQCIVLKDVVYG